MVISSILFDLDNTLIATRKGDKLACNKLSEVLWEKYAIPLDVAASVCASFLRAFRKCPENTEMGLHEWRRLLWAKALNCYSSLMKFIRSGSI
ncbi:uncharacterized protein LOC108743175 isoform X4 [Agrilus planipennis]|uniref:Uncharacterized protein LOC108743175 isoform X4 n=1 Tax=Agrilus planipennis TaxID=224129 RepID=A0A1W4XP24_AGRPL|nr:uncharacterized protein LOC108743175 isoform X4 [Agrilus planipennis]